MISLYRFVLAFHIIAVISWMAGILYLIRLFVYHRSESEAVVKARFEVMEYRLYKYITNPAMIVALVLGIYMLVDNPALMKEPWMHAKLGLVVLLIGVTHYASRIRKQLAAGKLPHTVKFFRIYNELPTLLMICIVMLVILRPF
jgi:protoporphyrinogen IX oxidase